MFNRGGFREAIKRFLCFRFSGVPCSGGGKRWDSKRREVAGMMNMIGVALHGIGIAMLLYSFALIFFF